MDLGQGGKAVQISAAGWQVIDEPPVVFVSKTDMAPLPLPRRGGSLEGLRQFVNVSDADFGLSLAFLLDALKGHDLAVMTGNRHRAGTDCAAKRSRSLRASGSARAATNLAKGSAAWGPILRASSASSSQAPRSSPRSSK